VLDFHFVRRNGRGLVARLAESGAAVKLPVVPRAHEVFTIEPALAERTARVVANIGYSAEHAILARDRELQSSHPGFAQAALFKRFGRAEVMPGFVAHAEAEFVG